MLNSMHTEGKKCQCVYPSDCGLGGCALHCRTGIGVTDLETNGLLNQSRFFSEELRSTCCDPCEQVNFDFGNGYNWLVSAWPYVTDHNGPPVLVVLPPRAPLRFCVTGADVQCLGEGSYMYQPNCDCADPCATLRGNCGGYGGFGRSAGLPAELRCE